MAGPHGRQTVNLMDHLFRVTREPPLTVRFASGEAQQPFVPVHGETLGCHHQPVSGPVDHIMFAAPVPGGFVMDPVSALENVGSWPGAQAPDVALFPKQWPAVATPVGHLVVGQLLSALRALARPLAMAKNVGAHSPTKMPNRSA